MKDKYLHTFRRQPDPAFANNLFQQIEQLPPASTIASSPARRTPTRKIRLAWAIATLLLMLALMAMVPGVRARFEDVLKQVGQMTIFMTEDNPGFDDPNIVPDEIMTLEEARQQVDFDFSLPDWVPEGLVLQENDIRINDIIDGLRVQWLDENVRGRALNLLISRAMPDVPYIVGPDSVTELTINDVPATLIRGGWYPEEDKWKDDGGRAIRWQLGNVVYHLSTGNEDFGGLSDQDLIKVAESIAPASPVD